MRDFSTAFGVDKMRSGNAAVYQLREEFETFTAAPQKLDACESIAYCFYQLEQYQDAASWYETAGRLILSEPNSTPALKALSALEQFERALECHGRGNDSDGFAECSNLIRQLKRAAASA